MIKISHRGNLRGPKPDRENHPDYVKEALGCGVDVEVDVWYSGFTWYLGHDEPQYEVKKSFLQNSRLWCHAKNIHALSLMLREPTIHCFWLENDAVTITSRGFLWTNLGGALDRTRSIACLPEQDPKWHVNDAYGICSDYVLSWENRIVN